MPPETVHLPNGQNLTVTPVFGGLQFKSNDISLHQGIFPPGWTVSLETEEYADEPDVPGNDGEPSDRPRRHRIRQYRKPTLYNDNLFISSISQPSDAEFKPATSPTRSIAMMLWATLYWYFHQTEPSPHLTTSESKDTPDVAKPKGDWRINIKREGVFRGKALLHKLERMGIIASEESCVGSSIVENTPDGWSQMFMSKRSFWQMSGKLFLFTLSPATATSFPYNSRPNSPARHADPRSTLMGDKGTERPIRSNNGLWAPQTPGPFSSGSHLPTYYPPPPPQYIVSNGVRHPVRPKPPRQGETFYLRFVPSIGQYLSFRVASLHNEAVAYKGPTAGPQLAPEHPTSHLLSITERSISPLAPKMLEGAVHVSTSSSDTTEMSDLQLLHKWMNDDRVAKFWGVRGAIEVQEQFLKTALDSRHSFPVIGCWDGKPFGYFELYWVKEDMLGKLLSPRQVDSYDRGIHVLVGEEEFRGKHRLKCWLTALTHWAFIADYRTNNIMLEPRVDNERFIWHLQNCGFAKEKEVSFPHKQAVLVTFNRENFEGPAL